MQHPADNASAVPRNTSKIAQTIIALKAVSEPRVGRVFPIERLNTTIVRSTLRATLSGTQNDLEESRKKAHDIATTKTTGQNTRKMKHLASRCASMRSVR